MTPPTLTRAEAALIEQALVSHGLYMTKTERALAGQILSKLGRLTQP